MIWELVLTALAGGIGAGIVVGMYAKHKMGPDGVIAQPPPWRIGTLGLLLILIGVALAISVIVADVTVAVALQVQGGLPEGLTTPLIALATSIAGSGGTCIAMRTSGD